MSDEMSYGIPPCFANRRATGSSLSLRSHLGLHLALQKVTCSSGGRAEH
ncbi:MAG TPA: hypothetical protein VGJ00_08600 [Rhabdochlamydiaceae bacterium]